MDCRTIYRDVPSLVDGDLRPRRAQEVTRHVEECAECNTIYREYVAFRRVSQDALAYRGRSLSFRDLEKRMVAIAPLEQVIRYQLPKLKIPGAVPRFAVAMVLLIGLAGISYAMRHTRQVYVAVQSPFSEQKATLTAALDDGRFPWDEPESGASTTGSNEEA